MERGEQLGGSMRFGLVFSVLAIAVAARADAQQPSTPTHLCAPTEVALFNSRMGMSTWNDMRTRKKLKGDKICRSALTGWRVRKSWQFVLASQMPCQMWMWSAPTRAFA